MEITLHKGFYPIRELRAFIAKICRRFGFNSKSAHHITIAIDEALTNIIKHSGKVKKTKLKIRLNLSSDKLTISIKDWGKPFIPKNIKRRSPNELIETKKEGGLGVLMMERIMDKLKYIRRKHYNELVMIKYKREKSNGRKRRT